MGRAVSLWLLLLYESHVKSGKREIRKEMERVKKQSAEGIFDDMNRSRIKKDGGCLQNNTINIGLVRNTIKENYTYTKLYTIKKKT